MPAMSNRRHYTQSERERWLARFTQHSSTASSFCREHSLCYQTFLRWRRQTGKNTATPAPVPFIELELPTRPANPARSELVELTFPSGLILHVQSHDPSQP